MKATSSAPSLPSSFTTTISFPPFVFLEKLAARCPSVSVSIGNRRSWMDGFNPQSSNTASPKATLRSDWEGAGTPASVPVRVAHELLQAGHRYLDVRTPEEFSAGHASGAINIPYMYRVGSGMTKNATFTEEVSKRFRKGDEIIIGCQSGKRSMMAAKDLLAAVSQTSLLKCFSTPRAMVRTNSAVAMTRVAGATGESPAILEELEFRCRRFLALAKTVNGYFNEFVCVLQGFNAVTDIAGGYAAWTQNGLPTNL